MVHAKHHDELQALIQQESRNSAKWLADNRLCVAGKKSKLLVIGKKKQKNTLINRNISININNTTINETNSEKLLGIVVNNELTRKNPLYGDEHLQGLIRQLPKRLGVLKMLSSKISKDRLKEFAQGIFYSKLNYCLPVFGHVFGLENYKETNSRYTSFTIRDNNELQVLQNSLNRLFTGSSFRTPTVELLKTNSLSIQQLIAHQALMLCHKVVKFEKPHYVSNRLEKEN